MSDGEGSQHMIQTRRLQCLLLKGEVVAQEEGQSAGVPTEDAAQEAEDLLPAAQQSSPAISKISAIII